MARVFSDVCDDCGSATGVAKYEIRTPEGKFQVDLCGKHGRQFVNQIRKWNPEPVARNTRGKRKVHDIDPDTGEPVV